MTVRPLLMVLLTILLTPGAWAAGVAASVDFRTGDVEFDAYLDELNVHAGGNLDGYIDHVSMSYDVPRTRVVELCDRYDPADVYLIVGYSHHLGMDIDRVEHTYRQHRGEGWGVIARELGIKPGSEAFHAMKRGARDESDGQWKGGAKSTPPGQSKEKNKNKGKGKG